MKAPAVQRQKWAIVGPRAHRRPRSGSVVASEPQPPQPQPGEVPWERTSRPRGAEVMLDGARAVLVRERETVASLFAGEHLLPGG